MEVDAPADEVDALAARIEEIDELGAGDDVNKAKTRLQVTPLAAAIAMGHGKVVKRLLRKHTGKC